MSKTRKTTKTGGPARQRPIVVEAAYGEDPLAGLPVPRLKEALRARGLGIPKYKWEMTLRLRQWAKANHRQASYRID